MTSHDDIRQPPRPDATREPRQTGGPAEAPASAAEPERPADSTWTGPMWPEDRFPSRPDARDRGLRPGRSGPSPWVIAIVLATVALIGVAWAAPHIAPGVIGGDEARDTAAREGARTIEFELETWLLGGAATRYPEPDEVAHDGAVGTALVDDGMEWPDNPFTGEPMKQGGGEGDFTYEVTADGSDFGLTLHLSDGESLVLKDVVRE